MSSFFSRLRGERLKNTGSLARDLLASERTFLAWTRTGLGFIALGVALEKVEALAAISPTLLHLENSRTKLAAGTYYGVLRDLQEGYFRPNRIGIMGLAMVSVGLAFAGCLLVMENEAEQERKKGSSVRDAPQAKAPLTTPSRP
ncbi:hypothetical protein LTR02_000869 [Friedmanniomyces endolithicus]|nr:hypothetical protein LTR59_001645 [Friedmanniomyces endolithicus]KAK0852489.1 hypothetical protein LTR03_003467 [Friedmanniomyces endolithicus]KAK0916322.1 hypothetical protein LTR02_000869 [Friedmanniomyces endolithicus]KAK1037560.1 hypothetical protein LTS16_012781 [Friedmanniomyces endolithicus]